MIRQTKAVIRMPTPKYPLLTTDEIAGMIDKCIKHERNRKILKRKLCDGLTYDAIAEEFSMSPRQIKRIVYDAEMSLYLR